MPAFDLEASRMATLARMRGARSPRPAASSSASRDEYGSSSMTPAYSRLKGL